MTMFKETFFVGKKEKLSNLKKGDIFYVKRIEGGYGNYYECKFLRIENGLVVFRPQMFSWNGNEWSKIARKTSRTKAKNCFLWGIDNRNKTRNDINYNRETCHWLD